MAGNNSGTIASSYSAGAVFGREFVGGLVGCNSGIGGNVGNVGNVDASYTRAAVASASGSSQFIGGFAEYAAAFPDRCTDAAARMGCPSGSCAGYELTANLDFDTDGDGATYTGAGAGAAGDRGDKYYNRGAGWLPIGGGYSSTFKGNGHVISNLFTKRTAFDRVGLFGEAGGSGRVESLRRRGRLRRRAKLHVGALAGYSGEIVASWTSGAVRANSYVGGLAGASRTTGGDSSDIIASCSRAFVHAAIAAGGDAWAGGLVGNSAGSASANARVIASYSTGAVTAASSSEIGGLLNNEERTVATNSYWDTATSGASTSGGGAGKTTSELQPPVGYAGIHENWNVDVDGAAGDDDPWRFGTTSDYPVLKCGGMDPYIQYGDGDCDRDDDALIEIYTLDRLNAVRYDLDGDGAQGSASDEYWRIYEKAFPDHAAALDGNNNKIANLTIRRTANADDIGLCGRVASGGVTWTDTASDGPTSTKYTPVAGDVGYCLRACAALNDTAPEGATEACVRIFAKTRAAGGG